MQQQVVAEQAIVLPLYAPGRPDRRRKTVGGVRFEPTAGVPASAYDVWIGK